MSADDKKKPGVKKTASKLGHDPLAWIDASEAKPGMAEAGSSGHGFRTNTSDREDLASLTPDRNISGRDAGSAQVGQGALSEVSVLNLPIYFGIAQSSEICSEMRKLLSSGCKTVQISGGEVESFDTAAVQLMMAFSNQALASGIELTWTGCSQRISEVRDLMGVNF